MEYEARRLLTKVTEMDGTVTTCVYDSLGERIETEV